MSAYLYIWNPDPLALAIIVFSVVYPFEISSPLIKGRNTRKNSN